MKFARFIVGSLIGAAALTTAGAARADVVTVAPSGSVTRSENGASAQRYRSQHNTHRAPRYNRGTSDQASPYARRHRQNQNNNAYRNQYNGNHRDSHHHHSHGHGCGCDITIIGDNTDVYIVNRPGYGYYPPYGGYPTGGYYYYYDAYGNPYNYGGYNGYYGNGSIHGDGFVANQNGQSTIIAGQAGMQPAFPNMMPSPLGNMSSPMGNAEPRLPGALYNSGRRR